MGGGLIRTITGVDAIADFVFSIAWNFVFFYLLIAAADFNIKMMNWTNVEMSADFTPENREFPTICGSWGISFLSKRSLVYN